MCEALPLLGVGVECVRTSCGAPAVGDLMVTERAECATDAAGAAALAINTEAWGGSTKLPAVALREDTLLAAAL